jgi:hypothetical protein
LITRRVVASGEKGGGIVLALHGRQGFGEITVPVVPLQPADRHIIPCGIEPVERFCVQLQIGS